MAATTFLSIALLVVAAPRGPDLRGRRAGGGVHMPRRDALLAVGALWTAQRLPADAAGFPLQLGGPRVELLDAPRVCQARVLRDDFVSVRYVARVGDQVVDERYATAPLTFQLGTFYLRGFDDALVRQCIQSKLRLTWARPPQVDWGGREGAPPLPANAPLVYDVTIERVEYEGFKEKMLDAANPEVFAPEPLTASSPAERRWYANARSLEPPGQTLLEFFELAD